MYFITDKKILWDIYRDLCEEIVQRNFKNQCKFPNDRENMIGIEASIEKMIQQLSAPDYPLPLKETKQAILKAKQLWIQYYTMKARAGRFTKAEVDENVHRLLDLTCEKEAELLAELRQNSPNGERIHFEEIFRNKNISKQLKNNIASDIAANHIKGYQPGKLALPVFYTTESDLYFHRNNCPLCKGKEMFGVTCAQIDLKALKPCTCLQTIDVYEDTSEKYCTIFIDESLRNSISDINGECREIGNYSYVICRGELFGEGEIVDEDLLESGVAYIEKFGNINEIPMLAIGEVLLKLRYNYDFDGDVRIFTDSQNAVAKWLTFDQNVRIAGLFNDVKVSFVQREKNTYADSLCRENIALVMPTKLHYQLIHVAEFSRETIKKCDKLEAENRELKSELSKFEKPMGILAEFFKSLVKRIGKTSKKAVIKVKKVVFSE